jgi:hypothetical protein
MRRSVLDLLLWVVHEVEIDNLIISSLVSVATEKTDTPSSLGFKVRSWNRFPMILVHILKLFYDMHDGTLLARYWTGHATRLEFLIPLPLSGNMLHD